MKALVEIRQDDEAIAYVDLNAIAAVNARLLLTGERGSQITLESGASVQFTIPLHDLMSQLHEGALKAQNPLGQAE